MVKVKPVGPVAKVEEDEGEWEQVAAPLIHPLGCLTNGGLTQRPCLCKFPVLSFPTSCKEDLFD